jgi:pilus assembly protein Flp/PilA
MFHLVTRFAKDEQGATMVEYGLLVVLIALVAAAGAQTLGNGLNTLFAGIGGAVAGATIPTIP